LFKNIVLPVIENTKNPSAQALIFLLVRGKIKVNTKKILISANIVKINFINIQNLTFATQKLNYTYLKIEVENESFEYLQANS
jgi:hypothetical protein